MGTGRVAGQRQLRLRGFLPSEHQHDERAVQRQLFGLSARLPRLCDPGHRYPDQRHRISPSTPRGLPALHHRRLELQHCLPWSPGYPLPPSDRRRQQQQQQRLGPFPVARGGLGIVHRPQVPHGAHLPSRLPRGRAGERAGVPQRLRGAVGQLCARVGHGTLARRDPDHDAGHVPPGQGDGRDGGEGRSFPYCAGDRWQQTLCLALHLDLGRQVAALHEHSRLCSARLPIRPPHAGPLVPLRRPRNPRTPRAPHPPRRRPDQGYRVHASDAAQLDARAVRARREPDLPGQPVGRAAGVATLPAQLLLDDVLLLQERDGQGADDDGGLPARKRTRDVPRGVPELRIGDSATCSEIRGERRWQINVSSVDVLQRALPAPPASGAAHHQCRQDDRVQVGRALPREGVRRARLRGRRHRVREELCGGPGAGLVVLRVPQGTRGRRPRRRLARHGPNCALRLWHNPRGPLLGQDPRRHRRRAEHRARRFRVRRQDRVRVARVRGGREGEGDGQGAARALGRRCLCRSSLPPVCRAHAHRKSAQTRRAHRQAAPQPWRKDDTCLSCHYEGLVSWRGHSPHARRLHRADHAAARARARHARLLRPPPRRRRLPLPRGRLGLPPDGRRRDAGRQPRCEVAQRLPAHPDGAHDGPGRDQQQQPIHPPRRVGLGVLRHQRARAGHLRRGDGQRRVAQREARGLPRGVGARVQVRGGKQDAARPARRAGALGHALGDGKEQPGDQLAAGHHRLFGRQAAAHQEVSARAQGEGVHVVRMVRSRRQPHPVQPGLQRRRRLRA